MRGRYHGSIIEGKEEGRETVLINSHEGIKEARDLK
jgi:hypothetical protein